MRAFQEPDTDWRQYARDQQRRLRDRLRNTLRGHTKNRTLNPVQDNVKDVTAPDDSDGRKR